VSEIRVGLVGYGTAGAFFHAPLIHAAPGLSLAAVVTRNPDRRAEVAAKYGATAVDDAEDLWGRCDLVVVDLPRHIDSGCAEALTRARTTLLLVPADVRGVLAAGQLLPVLRRHTQDIRAVLRGRSLAPDVAASCLGLPCAGHLPDQRGLTAALNRGDAPPLSPRSPLGAFCAGFLTTLRHEEAS